MLSFYIIINDFETLYGSHNVSFNVHSHLHLPDQVERFGPLNKLSCFPFEGVCKICSTMFHGTRNIFYQIAFNLNVHAALFFNTLVQFKLIRSKTMNLNSS